MRGALTAAAVVLALAGCGGATAVVTRGGTVTGRTLTVYSLLQQPGRGAGRDMVDAEKLAVYDRGGTAGGRRIDFVSLGEGAAGGGDGRTQAALPVREAIADPLVIALIGPAGSDAGMTAVPTLNATGILQVAPGAGYPGFTRRVRPDEPQRWQPGARHTLARVTGDDDAQARALLAAAGGRRARVAIEQEPGPVAGALAAGLRRAGARVVHDPARADAVVYAGETPGDAAVVADALAREAPKARVVLPDALTRAGIAGRLSPAARRRAVLVSSAPEPGSTPALRAFEREFRERLDRAPGPYAAVGYEAMRSVLAAIDRAGARAGSRQAVIDAYFGGGERTGTLLGTYRVSAEGVREPSPFTAFRPRRGGHAEYLRLGG